MKELSTEQKAKAYDEALKVLHKYDGAHIMFTQDLKEEMFPELAESEDEKIRKAILELVKQSSEILEKKNQEQMIDWLEKQDKETSWKPSKEEMDALYGLAYITNQYDEQKEEVITRLYQDLKREFFNGSSYENMFPNTEDGVRRRSTIQVLEYARSLDAYNQYGKADIDKNIAWLENQSKQKLANKVRSKYEPEFHEGDWIVYCNEDVDLITGIDENGYFINSGGYIPFRCEGDMKLWTIQDAKDGDFLVCGKDKLPFIFKGLLDSFHPDCPVAYCGICVDDSFQVSSGDGWWTSEKVFPATKEQREQLEKAISDAGYIWDAEKRQLKEIKFRCKGVGKKEETGALKKMLDFESEMITPEESLGIDSETYSKIVDECIYGDEQKPTDEEMKTLLQTEYEKGRADAIAEMQKSWSEEDEKQLNNIMWIIEAYRKNGFNETHIQIADNSENWLKSFKDRVQPKQEWSEEDDIWLNNLICHFETGLSIEHERVVSWLKFLRDRVQPHSQWKPSEEQMKALNYVVNLMASSESPKENVYFYKVLNNLREQLKKLSER